MKPWIGVDFDGTLVTHAYPKIGEPIQAMIDRIKGWLREGTYDVRIFTARVGPGEDGRRTVAEEITLIQDWLETQNLPRLPVTATKDFMMVQLWDDRAVEVEKDSGRLITDIWWNKGYDSGYKAGYGEGYEAGYTAGQEDAY